MRDRSIDKDLTLWQRMQLETLWGFCRIFAWTPYWFRYYAVQPVLVFLLMVIRYRRKVVLANLKTPFPRRAGSNCSGSCTSSTAPSPRWR